MTDNTSNRGFASMDDDKQREIESEGGQSQGKENNPGNLANKSSAERKKIARKGGESSHGGGRRSNR